MAEQSTYRNNLRQKILSFAMQEFLSKGIRAVRMDDIASHLGISKRTLYEIYADKESILCFGIQQYFDIHDQQLTIFNDVPGRTVMDTIIEFYQRQIELYGKINPTFHSDLSRYPSVMELLEQRKNSSHVKGIEFFRRGVEEGFFRPDIDYDIIQNIGDAAMEHVMEKEIYKKYPLPEIFRNFVIVFIRGFCTPKGLSILDKQHL